MGKMLNRSLGWANRYLSGKGLELKLISKRNYEIDLHKRIYGNDITEKRTLYNVGAGSFSHPCWTNIDFYSEWYKNNNALLEKGIHHDLFNSSPIPLPDASAALFYTSHTVEHIRNEDAIRLFNEAYRILKPGGIFRLTMPDIDLHYHALLRKDFDFYYWREWYTTPEKYSKIYINRSLKETSMEQLFLYQFASSVSTIHADGVKDRIDDEQFREIFRKYSYEEAMDYCLSRCDVEVQKKYPGNHINWWNAAKAQAMLSKAGFSQTYKSGYGQSAAAVMRNVSFFDSTHPKMSLYVEAVK